MDIIITFGSLILLLGALCAWSMKVSPSLTKITRFFSRRLWLLISPQHRKDRDGFKEKIGYVLLDHLRVSPQRFYRLFEAAIHRRRIPGFPHPIRVTRREGRIFKSRRECLRLNYGAFVFDLCAAPYGSGSFVSWRFRLIPIDWTSWTLVVPALWNLVKRSRRPRTEDQQDRLFLFEEATLRTLHEVIAQITSPKGVRPPVVGNPNPQFRANQQP